MRRNTFVPRLPSLAVWTLCAAALLSGCTGAYSGMSGDALTRTAYPRVTMAAAPPLTLQGYGREWVSLDTDHLGLTVSASMDYAVYADPQSGPVRAHAHVAVVDMPFEKRWRFQPESYPGPGGLSRGRRERDGTVWITKILRVDGTTDWFSAMWRASGRETPELWIARRFSRTPDKNVRLVMEYREPWPECLDPDTPELRTVSAECLEGFLSRADAALRAEDNPAEPIVPPVAENGLHRPSFPPDMTFLAGELMEEDLLWRR